jgi:hypothetical protein
LAKPAQSALFAAKMPQSFFTDLTQVGRGLAVAEQPRFASRSNGTENLVRVLQQHQLSLSMFISEHVLSNPNAVDNLRSGRIGTRLCIFAY